MFALFEVPSLIGINIWRKDEPGTVGTWVATRFTLGPEIVADITGTLGAIGTVLLGYSVTHKTARGVGLNDTPAD